MGGMLLEAALQAGIVEANAVRVADRDPARRERLGSRGVNVVESAAQLGECERIVLAVRPQQFQSAAEELERDAQPRLAISIMAGIGSDVIRKAARGFNEGHLLHAQCASENPRGRDRLDAC